MLVLPYDATQLKLKLPQDAEDDDTINLLFGGGGWKSIYFLGILLFLDKYIDKGRRKGWKYTGESGGAVYAIMAALEVDPVPFVEKINVVRQNVENSFMRGIFNPEYSGKEILNRVTSMFTDADVKRNRHKLALSTSLYDFILYRYPYIMKDFQTVDEITHAAICSGYIPGAMSIFRIPTLLGKFASDAGLTTMGSVPAFDNAVIVYMLSCGAPYNGIPEVFAKPSIEPNEYVDCGILSLSRAPSEIEYYKMIRDGYDGAAKFFFANASRFGIKLNNLLYPPILLKNMELEENTPENPLQKQSTK